MASPIHFNPFRRPSDDYFSALAYVKSDDSWVTADKLGNLIHFQNNGDLSSSTKTSTGSPAAVSRIAIDPIGMDFHDVDFPNFASTSSVGI